MVTAEVEALIEKFDRDIERITKEIMVKLNELVSRRITMSGDEVQPFTLITATSLTKHNPRIQYEYPRGWKIRISLMGIPPFIATGRIGKYPSNVKWLIRIEIRGGREFESEIPVTHNKMYTQRELERAKNSIIQVIVAEVIERQI